MFKWLKNLQAKLICALFMIPFLSITQANAFLNQSTDWVKSPYSQARLHLLGSEKARLDFAIEIELAPKYKTYWHIPGSNGVPPIVEVSGSNVAEKEAMLDLPLPQNFKGQYGETFGYQDKVAFFFSLNRLVAKEKTNINIDFHHATCDEICLPVSANFKLDISKGPQFKSVANMDLKAYKDLVPTTSKDELIKAFEMNKVDKQLIIQLSDAADLQSDIFIKDPNSRYYKMVRAEDGTHIFKVFGRNLKDWSADQVTLFFKNGDDAIFTSLKSSK